MKKIEEHLSTLFAMSDYYETDDSFSLDLSDPEILQHQVTNGHLICLINFWKECPDKSILLGKFTMVFERFVTHYEVQNKIVLGEFRPQSLLRPYFTHTEDIQPLAIFEPTPHGILCAEIFCQAYSQD